ncbi:MAG: succinyl-CoA synthetase [Desulfovibrio sp.]|jgi:FdrA protein|nr:succinyl-CoA synthetase [Desulfovibrio sp.]
MRYVIVRKNQYQDSVRLMQISRRAGDLPGVDKVLALLGTDGNKKIISDLGLMDAAVREATANDLVICVEAESGESALAAVAAVDEGLGGTGREEDAWRERPASIEQAVREMPEANFALISLPGPLAKLDALVALEQGLHVMLFSDNMSLEDELELKQSAAARDLLLLGPDCGTAIIDGVALGLANIVRRGEIGIAAASGTGIQEVVSIIDRLGGGISHAVGVGGRDLSEAIGGLMMRRAIGALARDPATRRLLLLSKPGAPAVMRAVLDEAEKTGLEVVACLLGADTRHSRPGMALVSTLEEAAFACMGKEVPPFVADQDLRRRAAALDPGRKYLRGLFSGGTLCYEALYILKDELEVASNIAVRADLKLREGERGRAHCCMDLGEDEFTRGRPHPIIDHELRREWLAANMADPEVKVILFDLVLGYGANRSGAADLVAGLSGRREGGPLLVAHVCGTRSDPQGLGEQEDMLSRAGVLLFPTNAQAARAALAVIRLNAETNCGESA